jgi:hypothetical protein
MDCVIVRAGADDLVVTEPRRVRRGDKVAIGAAEYGSEGLFVHVEGFLGGTRSPNEFRFMAAEVSRERPWTRAARAAAGRRKTARRQGFSG